MTPGPQLPQPGPDSAQSGSEPDSMRALLRELLIDTGDSILFVDLFWKVVEANASAIDIHRLPHDRIIGAGCLSLFAEADRSTMGTILQELGDHQSWTGEMKGIREGSQVFPVFVTIKRLALSGHPIFCLVIRDKTEHIALQELLRQEKAQRRELYITLRNLMKAFEKEKQGLEGGISHKIETVLLPAIEKVRTEANTEIRNSYLYIMREQLIHLTKGFSRELEGRFLKLTRSEIRVCQFIQEGHSTKEIAHLMNVSFETVQVHRRNIRKKLGLLGRKVNLYNLLSSRPLFQATSLK
ncbi:MAG: PAS and helix-turn-helix domain-containing protein [Desulfatirhabdiaceae bacterium]